MAATSCDVAFISKYFCDRIEVSIIDTIFLVSTFWAFNYQFVRQTLLPGLPYLHYKLPSVGLSFALDFYLFSNHSPSPGILAQQSPPALIFQFHIVVQHWAEKNWNCALFQRDCKKTTRDRDGHFLFIIASCFIWNPWKIYSGPSVTGREMQILNFFKQTITRFSDDPDDFV